MSYNAAKDPSLLSKERADKFGRQARAVTNNSADFDPMYAYIMVKTAGTLVVLPAGNPDNGWIDLGTVPAFFIPPWLIRAVQAGSTAVCVTIED